MNIDLDDILGFVLPKVTDGKQEDVRQMLTQTVQQPQEQSGLGGLLTSVADGLGLFKQQDAGAKTDNSSLLSQGTGLASMLPMLLTMIKPEYLEDVKDFIVDLISGKKKKSTGKSSSAKKKSTTQKSASAKKTTTGAKKSTTAKKPSTTKKSTAAKKPSTAKKSTTKKTSSTTKKK